ncbi:MAG: ATP-binding cassette domain-containing protein [Mariprofundaceae bacterium]|nr:ATP-binding cassette domain-containing protein [Mariprofundaceae bacterium]
MSLLKVESLRKSFASGGIWSASRKVTHAVSDVSFEVARGETLAIVGESGSGKSTTARIVMRLLDADAGNISLLGEDVTHLKGAALRRKRRHMQMVFQDPFASLNPRMKIVDSVGEGLRVHAPDLNRQQRRQRVAEILQQCGMDESIMDRYPHQFSGGQRQRIGIARALVVSPDLLVLDEPVSALDVSVQAQILNLLKALQEKHDLAYLFISHDLSVVRHVADRVAVMFAGHIVEEGNVEDVYAHPHHPYTRALLDARPVIHPAQRRDNENKGDALKVEDISGDVSDTSEADSGCPYRHRCPQAQAACRDFQLQRTTFADQHRVACLFPLEIEEIDNA